MVLTTDLQGMEFDLDRPSVVIGRTDENDIVLPHRSISRHHAKVVRDGEHHTIVDLQSANGVRVNGEDYERIELNPGDVVELGHVKLRFVGALEDFVFEPGASVRGPLKLKLGAVGIGLVGIAAVAFVLYRKDAAPDEAGAPRAARRGGPGCAGAGVASTRAGGRARDRAAGRAPPSLRPRPRSSPRPGRRQAPRTGRNPRRRSTGWAPPSRTRACAATRSRSAAASTPRFRRRRSSRSSTRRRARRTTPRRSRATTRSRAESIYKRRAKPRYEEARTLLVAEHMAAADKARAAGKCAEVRTEVAEVDAARAAQRAGARTWCASASRSRTSRWPSP